MNQVNDNAVPKHHDPFVLRKILVLLAVVPAIGLGVYYESFFLGFAVYAALVTLLDVGAHYILGLKTTQDVDPQRLLFSEGVSALQFEAYYNTRRWIRISSLCMALLVLGLGFVATSTADCQLFCASYILTTWMGIAIVRFSKIPRPRVIQRDDRYYVPSHRTPGRISTAEFAMATSGKGPMGVFES